MDLYFFNKDIGIVVGENEILKTTDSGSNWVSVLDDPTLFLNSVSFVNSNVGFAAGFVEWGAKSKILKTIDGGDNWTTVFYDSTESNFSSVFFIDSNVGYAAGHGNGWKIIKTTDGGENWLIQNNTIEANSLYFLDANTGYAVGSGNIYKTTDGGSNWIKQESCIGIGLNSVIFVNNSTGYIVGESGTILKTTNGGATFVEEEEIDEIPTTYYLSDNFPNPFNPSTKIKYSIPNTSKLLIKVYDILGNEIEILVNEEKPAGTYEITWYAEKLSSGIYFYRLQAVPIGRQAGSFVETKKMILLK